MPDDIAPATPSASLLLLRDTAGGIELLMARRNPELGFAGNFWVFPGGALDRSDQQQALAVDSSDELLPFRLNAVRETREEVDLDIEASSLVYFSHWIAPNKLAKRFDTRFFAVRAPAEQQPQADGSELVEVRWLSPAGIVKGYHQGTFPLMFPTLMNVRRLMAFNSVEQVLEAARQQPVAAHQPTMLFRDGKGFICVPAEIGFGATEWEIVYRG